MLQYVSDNLLAAAKRRGRIPDGAFSAPELLEIATEELETYLMPLIMSAQEDYYLTDVDFALTGDPTSTYRIPSRAVGGSLREISFLDASGNAIDVPRIAVDDMEFSVWGVKLQSQSVTYVNRVARQGPVTLRMTFALTPNSLCQAAQAAVVSAKDATTVTLAALSSPVWPLEAPAEGPAPASMAGQTSFDFIRSTPGFELSAFDVAGVCNGSTITFAGGTPSTVQVGDYVALAGKTPIPQCPTALWGLLAQSVAVSLLSQTGDERADAELGKRKQLESQVLPLIQNRIRGAPLSMHTRKNVLALTRRW